MATNPSSGSSGQPDVSRLAVIPPGNAARMNVEMPMPQQRPYGIFSVATVIDTTDPHILMGVQAMTDNCIPAEEWQHRCPIEWPGHCKVADDPARHKKLAHGFGMSTADPFTVYDSIDCRDGDYLAHVEARLRLKEQKAVERHIGEVMDARAGSPVNEQGTQEMGAVVMVLNRAEDWLAENYEGLGVMHMTPGAANTAANWDQIAPGPDGVMRTIANGTPVVVGAGYYNQKHSTDSWFSVWVTGQIIIYRGGIISHSVPGMQNGTTCSPPRALAERTYVPLFDCGAAKFSFDRS